MRRNWDSPGPCTVSCLRCISSGGSLPDVCLDTLTDLTSMVTGLEVGVWGRFPLSLWNGRATGCYPRSASTWGCHCNSSRRMGQVRGTCKGTCRREAPGTHHTLLLFYPDQILVLLPLVACMSLVSPTMPVLVTHSDDVSLSVAPACPSSPLRPCQGEGSER